MGVRLHFQSTGTVPGQGAPVTMVGPALTIGRGSENDLCLPDPGKVISKNHCAIEAQDGRIVVIDLSTNGTYLNYGREPLGPVPSPLSDGDILTIGSYELRVEMLAATPPAPVPDAFGAAEAADPGPGLDELIPHGDGGSDFLDELLGGGGTPVGPRGVSVPDPAEDGLLPPLGEDDGLLDPAPEPDTGPGVADHADPGQEAFRAPAPAAPQIPDDWEDDLALPGQPAPDPFAAMPTPPVPPVPETPPPPDLPPETPPAPPPDTPEGPEPPPVVPPVPETPPVPPPRDPPALPPDAPPELPPDVPPPEQPPQPPLTPQPPAARGAAGSDAAARAFLKALGAEGVQVPDEELEETMARLGAVMAATIQGLREILMTRASIKSEFRIQQTVIGAGDNNPLKFSVTPEQAVEVLVRPPRGYLPARAAVEQALGDIKAHEVAMMTAMEAALKGLLDQLSPNSLEAQLASGGGISGLLKGKKARYWDIYEKMYAKISEQAETDFQELFGREFARAYQAQTERLK
jgi:type VI secretion system FHA domain protein